MKVVNSQKEISLCKVVVLSVGSCHDHLKNSWFIQPYKSTTEMVKKKKQPETKTNQTNKTPKTKQRKSTSRPPPQKKPKQSNNKKNTPKNYPNQTKNQKHQKKKKQHTKTPEIYFVKNCVVSLCIVENVRMSHRMGDRLDSCFSRASSPVPTD